WLEFPARGIIRGEWDLCCINANTGLAPETFAGPEISFAPPQALKAYPFQGRITDSLAPRLDGALERTSARHLQEQAADLIGRAAWSSASVAAVSAARVSDFVRVDRLEGLAVGAGGTLHLGNVWSARASARYGIDDRLAKYDLSIIAQPADQWRIGAN